MTVTPQQGRAGSPGLTRLRLTQPLGPPGEQRPQAGGTEKGLPRTRPSRDPVGKSRPEDLVLSQCRLSVWAAGLWFFPEG